MINEFKEGVFLIDAGGKIIDCNQLASNQLGYIREHILGLNINQFLYDHIESIQDVFGGKNKGKKDKKNKKILHFRNKMDEHLVVEATVGEQSWLGCRLFYIIMSSVTHKCDYRQKEENLITYDQAYQQYNYIKSVYHPKIFRDICMNITNQINTRIMGVYLYSLKQDSLILQAGIGMGDETFEQLSAMSFQRSLTGKAYIERKPQKILINDHENSTIVDILKPTGIKVIEAYPIFFEQDVLGTLSFGYDDETRVIDEQVLLREIERLGLLAKSMYLNQQLSKELTKRLEAEEEVALFFEYTRDYVLITDEEYTVKRIGKVLKTTLERQDDEVKNSNIKDLVEVDDHERFDEWIAEIKEGNTGKELLLKSVNKWGEIYWASWIGEYFSQKGIFFFSGRDVTEVRANEEQQKVLEQAVIRENIKNEFFTNISHEFRTPINIVLSAAQLLESKGKYVSGIEDLQEILEKYLPLVKQNSYRLLRLVNNLLDMSKIDAGYYEILLRNRDIISTVENTVLSVADYIKSYNIKLIFDTDVEEKIIACDPDKVERVLLNLLSNAVKYAGEKGQIEVSIVDGEDYITIMVKDNGVGIDGEQQKRIFDRFIQVDGSSTRPREGTGIGLALVQSFVEMHNGEIAVESKPNQGCKFIIRLPVTKVEEGTNEGIDKGRSPKNFGELCHIEFSDIYD